MLKMIKIAGRFELWALASVAFSMSACGVFWAGGVDEETNTVAAADPAIEQHDNADITPPPQENVVIVDSLREIKPVETSKGDEYAVIGPPITQPIQVITDPAPSQDVDVIYAKNFIGKLNNTNGEAVEITVEVSGTSVKTQTDDAGYFELEKLPFGTFPMVVSNGNSEGVAYLLQNGSSTGLLGPVPYSVISRVDASDFKEPNLQNFEYKDEPATGNPEPVPEPDPESSASLNPGDGNISSSSIPLPTENYGYAHDHVATNDLPHDLDYGVMKHWTNIANGSTEEDSNNDYNWYAEWTVEASFELKSVDSKNSYRKNIFGKFNADGGVLTLAIINGECGTEAPSFALYVARYGNFSCKEAVISTAAVESGKKITLTGVFEGRYLKLYKDGFEIAEKALSNYTAQDLSTAPFVFGDKEIDMTLSDVRLGEKAITSADVLYRYYQQGGAQ